MTDFKDIKGFAFDVDGVMTDGGLLANAEGELFRVFDAKDGFGVRMAHMHGYPVAVITGGHSQSIPNRFKINGITSDDIYLDSKTKIVDFDDFCHRHGLRREDVMYFGDDVPDIEVLKAAGVGICPSDAADDAREAADIVSEHPGGKGFVRRYIEKVMKVQGTWIFDQATYEKKF